MIVSTSSTMKVFTFVEVKVTSLSVFSFGEHVIVTITVEII